MSHENFYQFINCEALRYFDTPMSQFVYLPWNDKNKSSMLLSCSIKNYSKNSETHYIPKGIVVVS